MARFKIAKDDSGKHTWMATGTNPKTGKEMTIRGGIKGTPVGKNNPKSERTFDARHDATGMSPKKYINKLRWDNKAQFGSTINIKDELFGTAAKKKAAKKKSAAVKKNAAKKKAMPRKKTATKRKTAVKKKTVSKKKSAPRKKAARKS